MEPFMQFRSVAQAQGVEVPIAAEAAAANPASLGEYCYAPTPMLAAVAAVGQELRRHPGEPLTTRHLPLELLPKDTLSQTLGVMLNASREPVTDDSLPAFRYETKISSISACDWGDQRLGAVALFAGQDKAQLSAHAQLITHKGIPVIMRKGSPGHPSAINIRPIILNGIPLPAGTILRVNTVHDEPLRELTPSEEALFGAHLPPPYLRGEEIRDPFSQCDIADVTQVGFGRLSSYALLPEERSSILFPHSDDGHYRMHPEGYAHLRQGRIEDLASGIDRNLRLAKPLKLV